MRTTSPTYRGTVLFILVPTLIPNQLDRIFVHRPYRMDGYRKWPSVDDSDFNFYCVRQEVSAGEVRLDDKYNPPLPL